ncbi:MAG: dethiobiotin synthase [Acidobacteria bacterium RBG_16_68_9]|nr:MAG: dethiobiotin synthase [Acidobacteria bacterium RBG_16_68_9]
MSSPRAFLLTGTDTGVGKTTVGSALAAALASRGVKVGVAKPFETGCRVDADGTLVPADAWQLRYFAGCDEALETICPIRCAEPLAPAVALRREGRIIDLASLRAAMLGIVARHEITLIEGAGGLLVPVARSATFADLARDWKLPVLIVVGNRLGALNHAQLTVRFAEHASLPVAGYIINTLGPEADLATETNVEALAELVGPPLGVLPWLGVVRCTPDDRVRLAAAAEKHIALDALNG